MKPKHKSIWVAHVTVTDPDTKLPVEVEIRKDLETGAMVGLDGSFLAQMDEQDTVCDPYNPGELIEIPNNETRQ